MTDSILDLLNLRCLCDILTKRYSIDSNSSKVMAGVGGKMMTEPDVTFLKVSVSAMWRTAHDYIVYDQTVVKLHNMSGNNSLIVEKYGKTGFQSGNGE